MFVCTISLSMQPILGVQCVWLSSSDTSQCLGRLYMAWFNKYQPQCFL